MGLTTEKTMPMSTKKEVKNYVELPKKDEKEVFVEGEVYKIVKDAIVYNESFVFPELYKIIKKDRLFKGDYILRNKLRGDEKRSSEVYPLIKSVHDTFVANLYETELSARAVARNQEDVEQTIAAQSFWDWASNIGEIQNVKELCRNEASLLGTSYAIGGVKEMKGFIEYRKEGEEYSDDYSEYTPSMQHISIFDMFYNRNATDFYSTQWKAYRKIISWDDCLERYNSWTLLEKKKKQEEVKRSTNYVSQKDFKRIYDIKNYEDCFCKDLGSITNVSELYAWMDKSMLQGDFLDNKNVEVIEYYTKGNLVILVNGVIIYDSINPLPNKDPFGIVVYENLPGCVRGRGIGHILMTHQELIDKHSQVIEDLQTMHSDPMYIVEMGALRNPDGSTPETIRYERGKVLENKSPGLPNGGVKPLQRVDFQAMQLAMQHVAQLKAEADVMVGSNSYVQGGQTKVERSSAGVNARLGVVRSRLRPITTSLARLECKMFETWLAAAAVIMPDEINVRVMGEDDTVSWRKVKPADIINKFDIECSNETNILETKMQRSQEMIQLIQTIIPNNVNPVDGTPIFDVVDLMRQYVQSIPGNIKIKEFDKSKLKQANPEAVGTPPVDINVPTDGSRIPGESDQQRAARIQNNQPTQQ